jgi:6-pyruvoyltetrahydropterin/6-carboxytetrahydropterin synthase
MAVKSAAYEVIVQQEFSSAHALRHYHGKTEPLHGHNFRVEVVLRGKRLQNKVKYLVDFVELQRALQAIVKPMDHVNLNDYPPFDRENPSAENLAAYIGTQLAQRWKAAGVRIASVTVWETPFQAARYLP